MLGRYAKNATMNDDFILNLKNELKTLRKENIFLREQIEFLTGVPDIVAGLKGETIIADAIGGDVTLHTDSHDVESPTGIKIEVKYSRLNKPSKKSNSLRWSWNYPMGLKLKKVYDRLILLGDADSRYREFYASPESPYVMFDLPIEDVQDLMQAGNHISITTNPSNRTSGTRRILFDKYQITLADLKERYQIKTNKNA
jgi:hypothetical protein